MKIRIVTSTLFVLLILSIFTPWFTYNATMMGYCWGFHFLKWLFLPLFLIGLFLFINRFRPLLWVLAEISLLATIPIYIRAFGRWQEVFHIITGDQWADGFHTAQPGYWFSVFMLLIFLIVFHLWLVYRFSGRKACPAH